MILHLRMIRNGRLFSVSIVVGYHKGEREGGEIHGRGGDWWLIMATEMILRSVMR